METVSAKKANPWSFHSQPHLIAIYSQAAVLMNFFHGMLCGATEALINAGCKALNVNVLVRST